MLQNKNFYTPTTQLHKELRYPSVKDIEKRNKCKFVHKQRNTNTPMIFKNLFTENIDIHRYNTRQSHNLAIPSFFQKQNTKKNNWLPGPKDLHTNENKKAWMQQTLREKNYVLT